MAGGARVPNHRGSFESPLRNAACICFLTLIAIVVSAQPFSALARKATVLPSVTISVSLKGGRVEAEYGVLDDVRQIELFEDDSNYPLVRSESWRITSRCASLANNAIRLSGSGCHPSVLLEEHSPERPRTYPAVIRVGNGVFIFTGYLAVDPSRFQVTWRAVPPKDGVAVIGDRKSTVSIEVSGRDALTDPRGWIYLGEDRFEEFPEARYIYDPDVPSAIRSTIKTTVAGTVGPLSAGLDHSLASKPTIFVALRQERGGGGKNFRADVTPGMMLRVGFDGAGWSTPSPPDLQRVRDLVAHEVAHFWNVATFRPRDESPAWIHEGGAELLSIVALRSSGAIGDREAIDRIDTGINRCLLLTTLAHENGARTDSRFPYDCGLLVTYLISQMYRSGGSRGALGFWRDFWRLHRTYDDHALRAFLNPHPELSETLNNVLQALASNDVLALRAILRGADVELDSTAAAPRGLATDLARSLFSAVMSAHCGATVDFSGDYESITPQVSTCGGLEKQRRISLMAGVNFLKEPQKAALAIEALCRRGESFKMAGASDEGFLIACTSEIAAAALASVRIARVDRHLALATLR
jgi:hypothetical protein